MKKNIFLFNFIISGLVSYAQVGVGTDTPDDSAALEVKSTTTGFLPPRLTYDQMVVIVNPAEGLMVYCTDCYPKGMYYFDGSEFLCGITGNTSVVPLASKSKLGKLETKQNVQTSREVIHMKVSKVKSVWGYSIKNKQLPLSERKYSQGIIKLEDSIRSFID